MHFIGRMSDDAKLHVSKNKDLPELGQTPEEVLFKILYPFQKYVHLRPLDRLAEIDALFVNAANESKLSNNSKMNKIFGPTDAWMPRMLRCLLGWGKHFRHASVMKVGPLSKMIDVHAGVCSLVPLC